jgi:hypothetical protein
MSMATSIEKKKKLEKLQSQVNNSQGEIDKLQASVTALTQQQSTYAAFLSDDLAHKNTAQANLDYVQTLIDGIKETMKKMDTVIGITCTSSSAITKVSKRMSNLINHLIYAVEVIDSLSQTIDRSKAANALIPDDLVTALSTASSDANNVITLCLTALQSCNTTMTTSDQSIEITRLEFQQSMQLYCKLTGYTLQELQELASSETDLPDLKQVSLETDVEGLKDAYNRLLVPTFSQSAYVKESKSLYELLHNAVETTKTKYTVTAVTKKNTDKELTQIFIF